MLRIPYPEVLDRLTELLRRTGYAPERAALAARLIAETTRDGVYSHGLNRVPRLLESIRNGCVDVQAEPEMTASAGALERWNGRRGPGNLNAHRSMDRAIALAREHGAGVVALAETNHWMRGGTYGWQAAEAGMIGICWTNTMPNLPPWGGIDPTVGNNPLIVAVPRRAGHVVLDIAMSQFSYGALESYRRRGADLPVFGGFDSAGNLTRNPAAIEESQRALPIGFWKGSGMSLMLDLVAATLAGGFGTYTMAGDPLRETGLSQVFCAFNAAAFGSAGQIEKTADDIVAFFKSSRPDESGAGVRYPGERVAHVRAENLSLGLPIEPDIWKLLGE
jgi:3-dehydro-L-gulonate 2-dehydrogenase